MNSEIVCEIKFIDSASGEVQIIIGKVEINQLLSEIHNWITIKYKILKKRKLIENQHCILKTDIQTIIIYRPFKNFVFEDEFDDYFVKFMNLNPSNEKGLYFESLMCYNSFKTIEKLNRMSNRQILKILHIELNSRGFH